MKRFKKIVEEASNGQLVFKSIYAGTLLYGVYVGTRFDWFINDSNNSDDYSMDLTSIRDYHICYGA